MNINMNKILIIDDEINELEKLNEILSGAGYRTISISDAKYVLRTTVAEMPDLIICSARISEPGCYDILKTIRENVSLCVIPFILITAGDEISSFREGMARGADDCIARNDDRETILTAVKQRLLSGERKRLQCEARMDELRDCIAYSMPHEIYTPLSIIFGYADLLKQNHEKFSHFDIIEITDDITAAARRMQTLFGNVLLYAKLEMICADGETERSALKNETVKVKEFIENLTAELGRELERENDIKLIAEEGLIVMNEEFLCKALTEIINNAAKFSGKGSAIEIDARTVNDMYVLSIKDNGRGMSCEEITKLGAYLQFERKFYEQQGLGLGLAIVKKIAELYRGRLSVESEYGISTTVRFCIPSAETERQSESFEGAGVDKTAKILYNSPH